MTRRQFPTTVAALILAATPAAHAQSQPRLWRICWASRRTGATGHGQPMAKAQAEAWMDRLRMTAPDLDHWLDPVAEWEA